MTDDNDYEISPIGKVIVGAPAVTKEIDCYNFCVKPWRANEWVDVGEQVRPSRPNGFAWEYTIAGDTGATEPQPDAEFDAVEMDGSAKLKVVAGGANGYNALSGPQVVSITPNVGLTVDSLAVLETRKFTAQYAATAPGIYVVLFSFVRNGETLEVRHQVEAV